MLAVSFAFPPLSYPRSIQVARLLKHVGLRVVLLCGDELGTRKDPTLEPDAEMALEKCLRVPFDESLANRLVNSAARRFHRQSWNWWNMTPDPYRRWGVAALKTIRRYSHTNSYSPQILATFSHPLSDHLIGIEIKKTSNIPWIACFSDPWVDNPFQDNNSNSSIRNNNLALEREVISKADRVIYTSSETADLVMSKYPKEWKRKVRVLPHCFDPSLFTNAPKPTNHLTIRHIGHFYGVRTPTPLFRTIQALLVSEPSTLRDVTFELIGSIDTSTIDNSGIGYPLTGLVKIIPPVDYLESLFLMSSADGLLIIDAPAEVSVFLPSKLIDYIGAGRPIFGFTPAGAAANLICQLGGWIADPIVTNAASDTLKEFVLFLRERNRESPWGNAAVRERYGASYVGQSFEKIVQELLT